MNVTAQFYKRLLWVYLFNVHCHNDNSSTLYYFLETEGKKNPSTVCSFVNDFIIKKIDEENWNIEEIILFSDAAGGQNKNMLVTSFCSWLAMKRGVKVTRIFPVRGHSNNVCDRNFGLCSLKIRRKENIHTLAEYVEILVKSRKKSHTFRCSKWDRYNERLEFWTERNFSTKTQS